MLEYQDNIKFMHARMLVNLLKYIRRSTHMNYEIIQNYVANNNYYSNNILHLNSLHYLYINFMIRGSFLKDNLNMFKKLILKIKDDPKIYNDLYIYGITHPVAYTTDANTHIQSNKHKKKFYEYFEILNIK